EGRASLDRASGARPVALVGTPLSYRRRPRTNRRPDHRHRPHRGRRHPGARPGPRARQRAARPGSPRAGALPAARQGRGSALADRIGLGGARPRACPGGARPGSDPRLVPRHPGAVLRSRDPSLPARTHQLGIHARALACGGVAAEVRGPDPPVRRRMVRAQGEHPGSALRLRRDRARHPQQPRWPDMRLAPTLVLVIFAAAALLWLSRDPAIHREGFPAGSSFGTGPEGTSLARAWLEATGSKVSTLSRPLDPAQLPAGAALLRLDAPPYRDGASPLAKDAPALTAQEEDLVRRGARLVLAIRGDESSGPSRKVSPLLPGVVTLKLAKPRRLRASALVDAQPVFEHGEAPSVARRPLGAGEVWFLSEPELFFNENLPQADNLVLLQALAGGARPVVFDELLHGAGTDTGVLGLLR